MPIRGGLKYSMTGLPESLATTSPRTWAQGGSAGRRRSSSARSGWERLSACTSPLLTEVDLRSRYPLPVVRPLIQFVIGAGFLFGLLAALLRGRKTLAMTGIGLSLAALLLGGADVPIGSGAGGRVYLGLDWFLLNLLLLAVISSCLWSGCFRSVRTRTCFGLAGRPTPCIFS